MALKYYTFVENDECHHMCWILKKELLPFARNLFGNESSIFQDDNPACS